MWKHACLFVCALIALVISPGLPALAQDPSTQPLLQFADLVYAGAFRLPRTAVNGDDLSHGGRPFTYNPARNSLFVGSRGGRIAEVSIPQLVSSAHVESLWFSSYLQGFNDPLEGNLWQVASDGAGIEGILVQDGAFYGTAAIYYDANNIQRVSHYTRSTDLAARSFGGMVPVWQADHLGFVAGYLAAIPPEWQAKLGGRAITGQCCTPIAWKTSWGPSAFAINPTDIGSRSLVAATPLLYYSADHPTLGHWNQTGLVYGATTRMSGAAIIAGTRTALFFGSTGTGPACYGNGTSQQSLHGTPSPDGSIWCYDPTSTDKGSHAYPYRYQIWAYDLNEFAAVKEGRKQPWEVVPYGVWPFDLPVPEPHARLGGIAYDAERQMLYLSQMFGDMDTFANRALIHALRINGAPTTAAPPPTSSDPTPSGSGTVTALALAANKVAPQAPGTTITWTATASGGISPRQYKWWVYDGATWTHGPWTTAHTFDWTPTTSSQYFRVAVWVRSYGAGSDQPEKSAESYFAISGTAAPAPAPTPPPPTSTATSVALTSDKAAPQAPGTAITFTAAPTGGVAPHQYWWWIYDGSSWIANGSWTTSRTFTWQPSTANASYRVAVWVRSAGSTGTYETSTERNYAISGTAVAPPPTTAPPPATAPAPTARVSSVSLTANLPAPQAPGTAITWTAAAAGGAAPHQYQWWIYNGSSWLAATGWTGASTYTWQPATANANYRVAVWARSAGSTGTYEAAVERTFAISGTAASAPPPPTTTTPTARATAVTISANLVQPQFVGTTITWTAAVTGGVAPHQYQWWTYDGTTWTSTPWTTSHTFAWKPTKAHSGSRVAVWVRSAGNTGNHEVATEQFFAIWTP